MGPDQTTLVFRVTLTTTAPPGQLDKVEERFRRELQLQFGSAVDVTRSEQPTEPKRATGGDTDPHW